MVQTQTLRAEAWKAIKEEKRPVVYTLDEPEKDDRNNLSLSQGNLANDKARVDLMQNRGKRLEAALTKQLDEKLLKQEPLNNRLIVDAIGVITSSWKEHYAKPCPEDLVKLMSDVGDLVGLFERQLRSAFF
ncbi:Os06g0337000 [Oryza sativa Japonica Group]|uniref:Os06g0337000 protein n=1 Tax=Oryza sativa subsp. japonica TaxID=39947 RepID=A0A0P0WWH8_ORYSJ|nr:Os06g0337000 [Oryza sativa Japonica Group]